MSHLKNVSSGKIKKPYLVLVYGIGGVGKSTFAAGAPDTIFIGPESGTNELDVNRMPEISTWKEIIEQVTELLEGDHDYKTLAIDSLDWCEPILWAEICRRNGGAKSIDSGNLGYGKGRAEAKVEWLQLKDLLNKLRDKRKMNIILLGHPKVVVDSNDPAVQASYSRYELKLDKQASALWSEYVDAVLFACFETFHSEVDGKNKAFSDGIRILYTERRAGWDAKNRYGLPLKLELNWSAFREAAEKGIPDSPKAVMNRIHGLISAIRSPDLKEKVLGYLDGCGPDDIIRLMSIEQKLALKLSEEEREG